MANRVFILPIHKRLTGIINGVKFKDGEKLIQRAV